MLKPFTLQLGMSPLAATVLPEGSTPSGHLSGREVQLHP